MSEEIKPDAYCAWHREVGIDFGPEMSASRAVAERRLGDAVTRGFEIRPVNIIEHEKWMKLTQWMKEFRSTGVYDIYVQEELIKKLDAIMGEK